MTTITPLLDTCLFGPTIYFIYNIPKNAAVEFFSHNNDIVRFLQIKMLDLYIWLFLSYV